MTRTRAITLHQPYATLVALGVKRIETRSWAAPAAAIGQRILIHAAAKSPRPLVKSPAGMMGDWWVVDDEHGDVYLLDHRDGHGTVWDGHVMPLGAIVASATLTACVPMVGQDHIQPRDGGPYLKVYEPESFAQGALWLQEPLSEHQDHVIAGVHEQRPYGDFAPGRWAWLLDDIEACDPIPAKGYQRIWWWET